MKDLAFSFESKLIGSSRIIHADCFEWLGKEPQNSLHAIVTDPPYGVKEYDFDQLEKRANGNGGIWRIPPSFGCCLSLKPNRRTQRKRRKPSSVFSVASCFGRDN